MKMMNKYCSLVVFLVAALAIDNTFGATGRIDGTVTQIFVETRQDPDRNAGELYYGGCMVKLSVSASTIDETCAADGFVTLACDGSIESKSVAAQNFSMAQLGYVTGNPVSVWVMGHQKINGYCYGAYVWAK